MKFLIWLSADCSSLEEIVTAIQSQNNEVGILLVQDGVFMADRGCAHSEELTRFNIPVYALKGHVEERGIADRLVIDAKLVDYNEIVDLVMEKYDRVVSL